MQNWWKKNRITIGDKATEKAQRLNVTAYVWKFINGKTIEKA